MTKYKKNVFQSNERVFSFVAILPHIIFIAIALGLYYFITLNEWFPQWQTYIYYGVRIFIAFEIILASGRSLLAPILAASVGIFILIVERIYQTNLPFVTINDGWQILIIAAIGFIITLLVKL